MIQIYVKGNIFLLVIIIVIMIGLTVIDLKSKSGITEKLTVNITKKKEEKRKRFSLYIFKAFRALGKILGGARDYMVLTGIHGDLVNFREKAQFDTHG